MNGFSIVLLIITTVFAITLGVWYGRSLMQNKNARQSKLVEEQQKVKHKRLNAVESFTIKYGRVTNREVQSLLNVSRATAERYLSQLEDDGKIRRRGAGRGAHYVLK